MDAVRGFRIIEILVIPVRAALVSLVAGEIHPVASFRKLDDIEIIDEVHSDRGVAHDFYRGLGKTDGRDFFNFLAAGQRYP